MVGNRGSRDPAGMRWILFAVAWIALAGVSDAPPIRGWAGTDLHFVDGYWLGAERPCAPVGETDCTEALPEATRGLLPAEAELVTGASVADHPMYFIDPAGNPSMQINAGLSSPWILVFDLADGRRKVVTVMCDPVWDGAAYTGATNCHREVFSDLRQRGPDPLPRY